MKNNKPKYTVKVCTDYVVTDPEQTTAILDRISNIISRSYIRIQQETYGQKGE